MGVPRSTGAKRPLPASSPKAPTMQSQPFMPSQTQKKRKVQDQEGTAHLTSWLAQVHPTRRALFTAMHDPAPVLHAEQEVNTEVNEQADKARPESDGDDPERVLREEVPLIYPPYSPCAYLTGQDAGVFIVDWRYEKPVKDVRRKQRRQRCAAKREERKSMAEEMAQLAADAQAKVLPWLEQVDLALSEKQGEDLDDQVEAVMDASNDGLGSMGFVEESEEEGSQQSLASIVDESPDEPG